MPMPPVSESDPYYDERLPKKRLWWLDWCRTQSVWNVVCGHAWWSACDFTEYARSGTEWTRLGDIGNNSRSPAAGKITDRTWNGHMLFSNIYLKYNDDNLTLMDGRLKETSNMFEYVVEQGTLHTIPLFFLLSGYVSAFSSGNRGKVRKGFSRFLNLWSDARCADAGHEVERSYDDRCDEKDGTTKTHTHTQSGYAPEGRKKEEDRIRFVGMDEYLERMAQDTAHIGETNFVRFVIRRFIRLILPFLFGTLCSVLPRAAILDDITVGHLIFSQMYFLYVLFAYAVVNFAWCRWLHLFKEYFELRFAQAVARVKEVGSKNNNASASDAVESRARVLLRMMIPFAILNLILLLAIPLIAIHLFHDAEKEMPLLWALVVFISFIVSGALLCIAVAIVSQTTSMAGLHLSCLFITLAVFQFIIMSFIMVTPPLFAEDGEYNWLSENMWVPFLFFEICYMFGFSWCVFEDYIKFAWKTGTRPQLWGVLFLLLSALWPLATFFGARTARRIGPWLSFYDDCQRQLGIFRTWSWMGILIGFAISCTNHPVHKRFHVHVTQSAMIIYIFHRLWEQIMIEALTDELEAPPEEHTIDRFGLLVILITFSFACSFATYFLLQLHWTLRMAFGIDAAEPARKKNNRMQLKEKAADEEREGKDKDGDGDVGKKREGGSPERSEELVGKNETPEEENVASIPRDSA